MTNDQRLAAVRSRARLGLSATEIAAAYDAPRSSVRDIARRKNITLRKAFVTVLASEDVWEMEEPERRAYFARRAADGARKALGVTQ